MSHFKLKKQLENLPRQEQITHLNAKGFSDIEIPDFLNWLMAAPVRAEQPKPETGRFQSAMSRMEARMEAMRASGEAPQMPRLAIVPDETPDLFQRDMLINRFILGGESVYDGASFHNPALVDTQVVQWYREVFGATKCRFALVLGGTGSGKTWGTIAYAASIAHVTWSGIHDRYEQVKHVNVGFVKAHRLADMVSNLRKFHDELDVLSRKQILVIDDLGCEPPGFRGADFLAHFENLINDRHMYRRITFMTANLTGDGFKEIYGERVVSRFNEIGLFKETTDPDFRCKSEK